MKHSIFCIVGGAGFVGSHLVDALIEKGAEKIIVVDNLFLGKMENLKEAHEKKPGIIFYKADATFYHPLEKLIEAEKPEVIYNLAVKPLPCSFTDPEGTFRASVDIAVNLAELLRLKKYKQLVHFSSSECYGTSLKVPMDESHPCNPTTPYGAGKLAADVLLQSYFNIFKINMVIVRSFNLYGERQNEGSYAGIIPLTICRILDGKNPIINWDGLQTRDLTYVKDVVDAAIKLSECEKAKGKAVNLGQGNEMSIKDLVEAICLIMDHPCEKVERKPKRKGDVRRHLADIDQACRLINYAPMTRLFTGLEKTVKWYESSLVKKDIQA